MSEITQVFNDGDSAQFNRDVSKIFIGCNEYEARSYTNSTYDDVTLLAGTVMGIVATSGQLKPLTSGASDGSQFCVGILRETHIVEAGDQVDIFVCVSGKVAEEKLLLQDSDTLETVVSGRRIRDKIAAETVGVLIIPPADELTGWDNTIQ